MKILHFRLNIVQANDKAEPHWPAPVSVVSRSMPSALL